MLKEKRYIIGIIALVLVVGLSMLGVKAAERIASVTINNVENLTMNVEGSAGDVSGMLGASGTRFPNGISADSTSPSAGEVRGTTLTSTGAANIGGVLSVTGETSLQGLTQGGGVLELATSTGTTVLTEAQMLASNYIRVMVNTGTTATLTLPATSTMTTLIPNAGDSRDFCIENATSSTMALTIAAGTGIRLVASTNAMDVIDETEVSCITFIRESDTDVLGVMTDELVDVD